MPPKSSFAISPILPRVPAPSGRTVSPRVQRKGAVQGVRLLPSNLPRTPVGRLAHGLADEERVLPSAVAAVAVAAKLVSDALAEGYLTGRTETSVPAAEDDL